SGGGCRPICLDQLSAARQHELWARTGERAAASRQRRRSKAARQENDGAKSSVPRSKEPIPESRFVAGGSRWENLAELTNRAKRGSTVYRRLSAAQRLPRLCKCGISDIQLEFRCPRKIPGYGFHGTNSAAVAVSVSEFY